MRHIAAAVICLAVVSLHAQSIATIVGGGSDDGQLATAIPITSPRGIAVDASGNVYFAEGAGRVRRVDGRGIVTTIAGNGAAGLSGDGGLAVNAVLNQPEGIVFDSAGNLYIADLKNNRIRRVDAKSGIITTFASDLKSPAGIAISGGFLYVAESDSEGNAIRRIDLATKVVEPIASNLKTPFGSSRIADVATRPSPMNVPPPASAVRLPSAATR